MAIGTGVRNKAKSPFLLTRSMNHLQNIEQTPTYLHVEGDIPVDIRRGVSVSITRKQPLKIYSLGFQPARSIPEIPRWFLKKYASRPFVVVDPFAGAGTTIVEAIKYGISAYWFDYHPLSRLICRVKTTIFSSVDIQKECLELIERAEKEKKAPDTIDFANRDFWFQQPVREALEILRMQILAVKDTSRPALWLAFASTVRKTSNMNDAMLLAARRPHIRKIPVYTRSDVFSYFRTYVNRAVRAIQEWTYYLKSSVSNVGELPIEDARSLHGKWKCDAVITSPPYINAIDYVWASKFELHWLGMVKSNLDRLKLYSKEVGTERIPRSEWEEVGRTGYGYLDQLIEDIYTGKRYKASSGQNQLRARVVHKYFTDMSSHFDSVFDKIVPGGYYCYAIGDVSRICGVNVPVASILAHLACQHGFKEQFRFHLLLKNRKLNVPRNVDWAGTIKHDTVVVLQRPT